MSNALFDAVPAAGPLVVPSIPAAGTPSRLLPGSVVGRVLQTRDANGDISGFYVLLANGVQKVTAFVADLLRTADSRGATAPQLVSPDTLVDLPEVEVLSVGSYPTGKLDFIDTAANPVSCVSLDQVLHRPPGHHHGVQRAGPAHPAAPGLPPGHAGAR